MERSDWLLREPANYHAHWKLVQVFLQFRFGVSQGLGRTRAAERPWERGWGGIAYAVRPSLCVGIPTQINSLTQGNLVPRACDPWEGNEGSGIIRFREESDWPLK